MASRPTCKSLQKQLMEMQHKMSELSSKAFEDDDFDTFKSEERRSVVYVQRDRKVPKFTGYNMSVEDWIEDVNSCCRDMSRQERADFIYSYLEGAAKEEVKYRDVSVRHNPNRILQVLQEAFGVKDNITKLQKDFFSRVQHQGESLREYSYALMDLIRKIQRKDDSLVPNKDKTLCDQFSQNVQDVMLRKHLKRIIRSQPDISFLDLREEAIVWSEEEESIESKDKCHDVKCEKQTKQETKDEMNQLLDMVKKQNEQIEALKRMITSKSTLPATAISEPPRSNLCFGCKKPGHRIANCPEKQGN